MVLSAKFLALPEKNLDLATRCGFASTEQALFLEPGIERAGGEIKEQVFSA